MVVPSGAHHPQPESVELDSPRRHLRRGRLQVLVAIFAVVDFKVVALRSARHATLFNRLAYVPLAVILAFFVGLIMGEPFLRSARHATLFNRLAYVPLAVILAFFVGLIMGEPFIPGNAERYANVLKTTEGDFAKDIEEVDYSDVPVIDPFFVGLIMGEPFIPGNAERYANVLKTTEGDFAKDIEEVDYSDVPVIDRASAQLLGSRAMGSIPEFVSQFEISPAYSQINYQGRPVRVSPLTYADLFKWLSHRGTGMRSCSAHAPWVRSPSS